MPVDGRWDLIRRLKSEHLRFFGMRRRVGSIGTTLTDKSPAPKAMAGQDTVLC